PGHHRRVDHRAGVGQLPAAVHPAARSGQAACGGADAHLLHRGGLAQPRTAVHVLAGVRGAGGGGVPARGPALRVPLPRRDQELMAPIVLSGLSKVYGGAVRAVDNLDLSIMDGEFFALLGPSGCGKTTLLRTIAGLEDATEGTVSIGGTDV